MKYFKINAWSIIFVVITVLNPSRLNAQDAYKKRYFVKSTINYKEDSYLRITRSRGKSTKPPKEIVKIRTGRSSIPLSSDSAIHPEILRLASSNRGLVSNIAFEKEGSKRLYINPWLIRDPNGGFINRDQIYYYELSNRQSVKIKFKQFSANVLVVPLKVRFGDNKTEFTTEANLGTFFGYTLGKTRFIPREKIGNRQYDLKWTFGAFFGAEKLEFTFKDDMDSDVKVKTAIFSFGPGILYAYQNITIGLTGGLDYSLGENSTEWDFYGKPWLGISIGYSLFYL